MSRPGPLPAALLAMTLLALAGLAVATGHEPPAGANEFRFPDGRTGHSWVADEAGNVTFTLAPGANATLHLLLPAQPPAESNATSLSYFVNVSGLPFANASATLTVNTTANATADDNASAVAFPFSAPATEGNHTYTFTVDAHAVDADGNVTSLGTASGEGVLVVEVAGEAPVPVTPFWRTMPFLIALALLVLGAVVVGAVGARRRRERERMNRAPRRSQVMREMELERKLERAQDKDPGQAAVIKQEIRQAEQVREKRRELQILEAKRADALKTLDLLKKRHEAGGLTKLQYDNMVAKKRVDLERIEAEIAQMEAEDAAGGSAAA